MKTRTVLVLILLVLTTAPAWGYIDPGTGSMLFSAVSGIVVTVYFFFKTLFLKLKTLPARLLGRAQRGSASDGLVVYTEGRQYWSVFQPILAEWERRGRSATVYTSDPDDPVLRYESERIRAHLLAKGHAGYFTLNSLEAALCLTTTPGLDVYHWTRSRLVGKYVHVLHAPNDVTLYRLFGLDYYDVVLVNGEFQNEGIRELEVSRGLPAKTLITVGSTYLDVLAVRAREVAASLPVRQGTTVLVSPSWGPSGLLRQHGLALLAPLAESGLHVIIRPHPQTRISEADTLETLTKALADRPNVEWDFERENVRSLARADLMISDFSGIIFDFVFLFSRPVLYTSSQFDLRPYDAADLQNPTWTFQTLPKIGRELNPGDFPRVADLVRSLVSDRSTKDAIEAAKAAAWPWPGESASRVADALESLLPVQERS